MSSTLRLSIIAVLALAAAAFGSIAYNINASRQVPVVAASASAPPVPAAVSYFVAARPLSKGTLVRAEDFIVRSAPHEKVPEGAILETADNKASLPGSLVRKFVDAGNPVTLQDILRPRDRGFLASVLAPDSRAISIKVDEESGVSGLIRPGDHVDVVLTRLLEKADPARRALSETILSNVRAIAIDQELAEGGRSTNVTPGKSTQTVSLELTPEQVKRITVAKQLGSLSLAVRAAVDRGNGIDTGAVSSCDVSPELAREDAIAGQSTTIVVHAGGETKRYVVRRQNDGEVDLGCEGLSDVARRTATAMGDFGKAPGKR
jgi:pilus assembly protein CpaB